jgi:WD40 repeat protein
MLAESECMLDIEFGIKCAVLSPCGKFLAVSHEPNPDVDDPAIIGSVTVVHCADEVRELAKLITHEEHHPDYKKGHHQEPITCVAFSVDSSRLFTTGGDGTVSAWKFSEYGEQDTDHMKRLSLKHGGLANAPPADLAASATELLRSAFATPPAVAPSEAEGGDAPSALAARLKAKVHDVVALNRVLARWRHESLQTGGDNCSSLSVSADGRWVASATWTHGVTVWHAATLAPAAGPLYPGGRIVRGNDRDVSCVAFAFGGTHFAMGDESGAVEVWDTATWTFVRAYVGVHSDGCDVLALGWSHDGVRLVTCCADDRAVVWNVETAQPFGSLPLGNKACASVAFSNDDALIATSGAKSVALWCARTLEIFATLPTASANVCSIIWVAGDAGDAGRVLITAGGEGEVLRWRPRPRGGGDEGGNAGPVVRALRRNGAAEADAAAAEEETEGFATPVPKPKYRHTLMGGAQCEYVAAVDFDACGRRLLVVQADLIIVFDVATMLEVGRCVGHTETINMAEFSREREYHVARPSMRAKPRIVSASEDKTAIVWCGVTFAQLAVLRHRGADAEVAKARWSPNSAMIATVRDDGVVTLWDSEIPDPPEDDTSSDASDDASDEKSDGGGGEGAGKSADAPRAAKYTQLKTFSDWGGGVDDGYRAKDVSFDAKSRLLMVRTSAPRMQLLVFAHDPSCGTWSSVAVHGGADLKVEAAAWNPTASSRSLEKGDLALVSSVSQSGRQKSYTLSLYGEHSPPGSETTTIVHVCSTPLRYCMGGGNNSVHSSLRWSGRRLISVDEKGVTLMAVADNGAVTELATLRMDRADIGTKDSDFYCAAWHGSYVATGSDEGHGLLWALAPANAGAAEALLRGDPALGIGYVEPLSPTLFDGGGPAANRLESVHLELCNGWRCGEGGRRGRSALHCLAQGHDQSWRSEERYFALLELWTQSSAPVRAQYPGARPPLACTLSHSLARSLARSSVHSAA